MKERCPQCGYEMEPFDKTCKRCEYLKRTGRNQSRGTDSQPELPRRSKMEARAEADMRRALMVAWFAAVPCALLGGFLSVASPVGLYFGVLAVVAFECVIAKVDAAGGSPSGPR